MAEVVLAPGADEVPLAIMLGDLLKQNLEQKPEKIKDFNALCISVGIDAVDAEAQITLQFQKGTLTVHGGLVNCDLVISTDAATLLGLSNMTIKFGLPWYFDKTGMEVIKKLLKRELKIKGLLLHPFALTRLTKVMSVA